MAGSCASLMSVPVRRLPNSATDAVLPSPVDYGLLLNRVELARYNGRTDELPILIAYHGRIYDVTGRASRKNKINWRRHAGRDCTAALHAHPDRDYLLTLIPCVGLLED